MRAQTESDGQRAQGDGEIQGKTGKGRRERKRQREKRTDKKNKGRKCERKCNRKTETWLKAALKVVGFLTERGCYRSVKQEKPPVSAYCRPINPALCLETTHEASAAAVAGLWQGGQAPRPSLSYKYTPVSQRRPELHGT